MTSHRNIPIAAPELDGKEGEYVQECISSTWISSAGRFISEFEEAFANFCESEFAIATNNGTTALHLALTALGVGPGDEVIVPTLTFVATANAVRYCHATPVLVDSEPEGMTMDVEQVRRKITDRTKAIIPVHLYGRPADMHALTALAAERGVAVIEDAAEAHGARVGSRAVGSLGTCGAFSFFGNKIVTTGEGGAVTTNDPDLARRLRLLRGQGMDPDRRYWFPVVGFNYRMTNIAAAIGLAQLEGVERKLQRRKAIATTYDACLADNALVARPMDPSWCIPVNWLYTVMVDVDTADQRDEIMRKMAADGIETRPVFYPMHQLPPYLEPCDGYPVAESLSRRGLSLPTHTGLNEEDIQYICRRLNHHATEIAAPR